MDPSMAHEIVAHLQLRAGKLELTYPLAERDAVLVQLSAFLTTLAMNYVYRGGLITR
jgi:hypothetical protein